MMETRILSDIYDRFADRFHPARVAAGAYSEKNDILLFLHIPKTAGVSVGAGLRGVFDNFLGVDWDRVDRSFVEQTRFALYERSRREQRQVLMGHFRAGQLNYWRNHGLPIKAATIVRDPVDRVVSHYNYNCSERHPNNLQFRKRFPTLSDFVGNLAYDFQLNAMLGAFYSFEHALEKLAADFTFLGLTEKLPESLEHLSRSHGLDRIKVHKKNKGARQEEEISDADRQVVVEKSANDIRLVELLRSFYQ